MEKVHKAGFVNIIGKPNVGKSTLMNVMVGEKLSIITSKAQTTRHRIMGILNGEDFQIVYSDTPGIINPHYELHRAMMQFVNVSLEDADVILFVTDIFEKYDEDDVLKKLKTISTPILLLINKVDLAKQEQIDERIAHWQKLINTKEIIPISALHKYNIEKVFDKILEFLPEHPPYYPKDELTDRSERFFAAEIIREKIFMTYAKEIPYSCEVIITSFKEEEDIIRISAEILVERPTQKSIVIGKGGEKLKKVGTEARKDLEEFFQKKIFLEQHVKVEPDWRNKKNKLISLGYIQT
jgi:GTP-binding protein Era